jgi:small nuclear ribonucleoprotein F
MLIVENRVNEEVIIRLKWGQTEYKGRLVSIDSYMNIQLSGAEEWIDQQMTSVLGQVLIRYVELFPCGLDTLEEKRKRDRMDSGFSKERLIVFRCNNVLWIQGANQNNGDTKMSE